MVAKKQALKIDRKALSSAGLRMTRQRALILEIIRHRHLDADEVYRQAREKQPRFSLSTVYRTLRMLKEQGLVDELHFGEAHHHYEVKPSAEHHHLVCLGCGKIVEFECKLSQKMKQDLARKQGFEVTGVEINMTGYCSKCRQRRE
jgi:Fur family ferric uptake transcriptional regulator